MLARVQLKSLIDALRRSFRRRGQAPEVAIAGMLHEGHAGRSQARYRKRLVDMMGVALLIEHHENDMKYHDQEYISIWCIYYNMMEVHCKYIYCSNF